MGECSSCNPITGSTHFNIHHVSWMIARFPRAEMGPRVWNFYNHTRWFLMGKFGQHCFGIFGSTKVCFTDLLSYVPANSHPSGKAQAPVPASHSDLGGNEGRRMLLSWSCSSVLGSQNCLPSPPSSIFDGVWERASFCCHRFALLDKMFSFIYK